MDSNRELAIDIINEFEELLKKYDLEIPNEEKENSQRSCIYGTDYFDLEDKITELLERRVNK